MRHALVWVSSFVLMLWTIPFAPVQRTQEARVLVSAREMLENAGRPNSGLRVWMIPTANGIVRLQKPPLAYWMAAASFKLFGVHDWAGRLPFALCGWLTVVLTYHIGLSAFAGNTRIGLWSAALLVGSFLFYRHGRLAETDIVVTLALTVAIFAIWRGFAGPDDRRQLLWFAISGIAIGVAGLAKGPPALCALLFLAAFTFTTRRWRTALRWLISGAPLLAAAIGLSWWIYIVRLPEAAIVQHELKVLFEEPNHPGWFFIYIPQLLQAMLPWTPVFIAALIDAGRTWKLDRREFVTQLGPLLLWSGAILVPLLFLANKQSHYLLPMMPPLALIAGWWLDRAYRLSRENPAPAVARTIVLLTAIAFIVGAWALPFVAREYRGDIETNDLIMPVLVGLAASVVIWLLKRDLVRGIDAYCLACAIGLSVIMGFWWPTSDPESHRIVARRIRELGGGPYCFYGDRVSLPLVYNLRTVAPAAKDARELTQLMSEHPDLVIITPVKASHPAPPEPIGCETVAEIVMKDQKFEIYRSIQ